MNHNDKTHLSMNMTDGLEERKRTMMKSNQSGSKKMSRTEKLRSRDFERNIRVIAINGDFSGKFSICLEFSGHREFLMLHRYHAPLYNLLKGGVRLEALRRYRPSQAGFYGCKIDLRSRLYDRVSYLLIVIEDYLTERREWLEEPEAESDTACA